MELLKNGVEIIDSPGLNEHETIAKVTNEYMSSADAIVFVLNAQQLCSQEEMKFIENNLQEYGFAPFFVVNRFDAIREKEKASITGYAHAKLDNYTSKKIYFVSALDGLYGKMENDDEKLVKSGITELEKDLALYLTNERGKAKLNRPAKVLDFILNFEASKCIERKRKLLNADVDVMQKIEIAKVTLQTLKERKILLQAHLNIKINTATKDLFDVVRHNNEIIISKISCWVDEYPMENDIGAWFKDNTRNEATNKLVKYIETKIDEHQKDWNRNVLQLAIKEKIIEVFKPNEKDLISLYSELDTIIDTQDWFNGEYAKSFFLEMGSIIGLLKSITPFGIIAGVTYYISQDVRDKKINEIKTAVKEKIVAQVVVRYKVICEEIERKFENFFLKHVDKIIADVGKLVEEAEQRLQHTISEKVDVTTNKEFLDKLELKRRKLSCLLNEIKAYLKSNEEIFIDKLDQETFYIENLLEQRKDFLDQSLYNEFFKQLSDIKERLHDKLINISVIGDFSVGKSAFINALIRSNLLDMDITQSTTTASVIISHGNNFGLTVSYKNSGKETRDFYYLDSLKTALTSYMSDNSKYESIEKIDVTLPSKILEENKFRIIDTPGLNTIDSRLENITRDVVERVSDISIIIIDANMPLKQAFCGFIKAHMNKNLSRSVFLVTKIDFICNEEDKKAVLEYIKNKIKLEFGIDEPLVLPYDSVEIFKEYRLEEGKANKDLLELTLKSEKALIDYFKNTYQEIRTNKLFAMFKNLYEGIERSIFCSA